MTVFGHPRVCLSGILGLQRVLEWQWAPFLNWYRKRKIKHEWTQTNRPNHQNPRTSQHGPPHHCQRIIQSIWWAGNFTHHSARFDCNSGGWHSPYVFKEWEQGKCLVLFPGIPEYDSSGYTKEWIVVDVRTKILFKRICRHKYWITFCLGSGLWEFWLHRVWSDFGRNYPGYYR